jgi:hypothetical protein
MACGDKNSSGRQKNSLGGKNKWLGVTKNGLVTKNGSGWRIGACANFKNSLDERLSNVLVEIK